MARVERVEVRLDGETRRKLREVASSREVTVSEVVREAIERSYEAELLKSRIRAADDLGRLELEEVPAMETLRRQLEEAHGSGADLR